MSIEIAGAPKVRPEELSDPRTRLAAEAYFTLRPKPLERWIWKRKLSAAAERVFWLHWAEGARNRDWCSEIPLHTAADHCQVNISTITRAYQALRRCGLIRRTDPGRDPTKRFEQAIAVTEVLLPHELLAAVPTLPRRPLPQLAVKPAETAPGAQLRALTPSPVPANPPLNAKERRNALEAMLQPLSAAEKADFNRALCSDSRNMLFAADSTTPEAAQQEIHAFLARCAPKADLMAAPAPLARNAGPRRLTMFEVARLRQGIQKCAGPAGADELTRQVLWAAEEGALLKFSSTHAINIALKKLREGLWSRPNRMPPNWVRRLGQNG